MRSRRLIVLAGLAAACAQTTSGPGGGVDTTAPDIDVGLSRSRKIAASEISVDASGAWTYRRAGAAGGAAGKDSSRALAGGDLRGREELSLATEAELRSDGAVRSGAAVAVPEPKAPPAPKPAEPPTAAKAAHEKAPATGAAPPAVARPGGLAAGASGGAVVDGRALQAALPLRAGATDDNADFAAFVKFLGEWPKRPDVSAGFQPLDVRDRRFVRVVDASGRPVPATRVSVVDEAHDRVVGRGTTYGDGRVPLYPRIGTVDEDTAAVPAGGWFVEVRVGGKVVRSHWDGRDDEFEVRLANVVSPPETVPIDVAFLIDTTGSMSDEIASIQACLLRVTEQIRGLARETDLRCGTVLYRDIGDEYLTATHALTSDIGELDKALREVRADGGGDGPESLNQGLAEAVDGLAWRDGAAKVVFLIADAPPHMDYAGDTTYGESVRAAVAKGIRVHTVAASGLDPVGSLVFRQIAQYTRGKFIFLEYGGDVAKSAAAHGVGGAVKNDNLEDILFEQIRDEVARFGR